MALQEQGYGGATARDCAAEMFAQEVAEALVMMAQSQGLTISVDVCGATVLAQVAGGGSFSVTVAARGSVVNREEARRKQAERLTEETGEGLVVVRSDGRRERIGAGGKLEREESSPPGPTP